MEARNFDELAGRIEGIGQALLHLTAALEMGGAIDGRGLRKVGAGPGAATCCRPWKPRGARCTRWPTNSTRRGKRVPVQSHR